LAGALQARVAGAGRRPGGFGEPFGGGDDVVDETVIPAIRIGRGARLAACRAVWRQKLRAEILADMLRGREQLERAAEEAEEEVEDAGEALIT